MMKVSCLTDVLWLSSAGLIAIRPLQEKNEQKKATILQLFVI